MKAVQNPLKHSYILLFSVQASKKNILVFRLLTWTQLVLLSLAGWVMWYSGNIEGLTSRKELGGAVDGAVDRLARSLSRRIRIPWTHSSPT
uniref:Uncharacterized protein n=1 Tax=Stegastes partitus TaxID=144197 RepID=A0A3B5AYH9_9TELE